MSSLNPRSYRSNRPISSSSSLTRPLSVGSNLSSSSSITGERRRRSAILLEQELGTNPLEDTPGRRSIRNSISRAEEVLRASERQRELERRKERVGLRARQLGQSTRLLEELQLDDTTEELDVYDTRRDRNFNEEKLLRKAPSIPTDLPLRPTDRRRSISLTTENVSTHQRQFLSRPVTSPSIAPPPQRPLYETHLANSSYLSIPAAEPTSKFSASSGDSIIHVVAGNVRSIRLKDRARSFNQASANGIKTFGSKLKSKTPSKLNLRQKPSLAGIFRDPSHAFDQQAEEVQDPVEGKSNLRQIGHGHNSSISSSALSTDRDSKPRASSRRGFFRSALRDSTSTSSSSNSRPRSAATISPSIVSAARSNSSGGIHSSLDKRNSASTSSSTGNSEERKRFWVSRIGRTIRGKNVSTKRTIFEDDKENEGVVHLADKVKFGSASPRVSTFRPPSRVPVDSVFANKTNQASAPPRPLQPSTGVIDSRVRSAPTAVKGQRQGDVLASIAPRVRAKFSKPITDARPLDLNIRHVQQTQGSVRVAEDYLSSRLPFSDLVLLPPNESASSRSVPSRKLTLDKFKRELAKQPSHSQSRPRSLLLVSPTSSSSDEPSSPARSFRSPSPARFRDLLPSGTASSPEKNEKGLPVPSTEGSPRSIRSKESPTRRRAALGPENIICMTDTRERTGPISEVRGATTDLADLLSGLEETQDYDRSRSFNLPTPHGSVPALPEVPSLPPLHRQQHALSHVESIESLRSTVSDVPEDLKDLINAVEDHISEVEIPSFVIDGYGMHDRGFADENYESSSSSDSESDTSQEEHFAPAFGMDSRYLSVNGEHTKNGFTSSEGATSTRGFDLTVSSFEGHVSTAANVLRDMLGGVLPPLSTGPPLSESLDSDAEETENEDDQNSLSESVREALEVGRPSAGDRMFERLDCEVSLSALVDPSPPPSPRPERSRQSIMASSFSLGHFHHDSAVSSAEGTESTLSFVHASPTPNPASQRPRRHSLSRYSQDSQPPRHPSHRTRALSSQFSSISSSQPESLQAHSKSSSSAPSSHTTYFSITSSASSPCPAPRNRRISMLTRSKPPPLQPSFRFPAHPIETATFKVDIRMGHTHVGTSTTKVDPTSEVSLGEAKVASYSSLEADVQQTLLDANDFDLSPPSVADDEVLSTFDIISSTILEENEDFPASPLRSLGLQLHLDQSSPSSRFAPPSSPSLRSIDDASEDDGYDDVLDSGDDYDFTARDPELTRKYVHLSYEAETEIRRSQTIWPDTDRSREAVALFDAPKTYRSILDFLLSSRNLFPSPPHLARLSSYVPLAFADPPTPPSPISPTSPIRIPSPLHDSTGSFLASTPPSPPSMSYVAPEPQISKPVQPVEPLRRILGNKSVNVALSSSTSAPKEFDVLSPFTALPPRIGSKLPGLKGSTSPAKKKKVDTSFLGDATSRRRQAQFNAAARRLEGTGFPEEQRSDDDTDDTGVLEAKGEATDDLTFAKTPPTSIVRPRGPRRNIVSALR
ncbi:uncharacterized protein JCM6883_007084 [Sporobolomyces salmoneus]|uniref:uncharacterized protein n=1 Tax=Sporobolomyces salmoneus TaxID=183962 RepID=UPI00317D150A